MIQQQTNIPAGQEEASIAALVRSHIIDHWSTQDEPVHLRTIRDRLQHHPARTGQLLGLYRQILDQDSVIADGSTAHSELQLSGLVVNRQGQLTVYNRIYRHIFTPAWIEQELAALRPYAEMMQAGNDQTAKIPHAFYGVRPYKMPWTGPKSSSSATRITNS